MTSTRSLPALALVAVLALAPAGCGGSDDEEAAGGGNSTDRAFLSSMVAHHESAIEMTDVARRRGENAVVKRLAGDIAGTQRREIAQMKAIHERLFDSALVADDRAHDKLGLSAAEAGMTHTDASNRELERAPEFDRAFVDEMVPHHHGAVRMSEVLLAKSKDGELRRLAQSIISTQKREIDEMNAFREREYGAPVPRQRGHGDDHGVPPHHPG